MNTEIIICSDEFHESPVAEIYLDKKYIALVGIDENEHFFVELPTPEMDFGTILSKVEYAVFIDLLEKAKEKLKQ